MAIALLSLTAAQSAAAAGVTEVRLLAVGKAEATLSVDLDAPGLVVVSWGETPGAWTDSATSDSSDTHHQMPMPHLQPDTRYFYQLSIDGQAQGDVFTFQSGRSWVTRRASILVTADLPQGVPAEVSLAERLFAEESDALILLGSTAVDPAALRTLHGRSMAEKVVVVVDDSTSMRLDVADVRVMSDGPLPPTDDGNCWRVSIGDRAPAGAEIIITRGPSPSIALVGGSIRITLNDPETDAASAAPAATRADARLDFVEGHLVATLRSAEGTVLGKAELTRACKAPAPKESALPAHSADGEEPGTSDGDADVSDCDVK